MKKVFWVAQREFVATVFTKAFVIGLLFLPVMIVIVAVVMNLLDDDDFRASGRIAILDPSGRVAAEARRLIETNALTERQAEALRAAGEGFAEAAELVESLDLGPDFTLMQLPTDADLESEKQFLLQPAESGGLLALVDVHDDAIVAESETQDFGTYDVYTAQDIDQREMAAVRNVVNDAIVNLRIEAYGLERETIDRLTRVARGQSVTVTETEEREAVGGLNVILPGAFMFLLFIGIMGGGQGLMTSTIEEKASRVVEVLLSAVSPLELMAGKLLGFMAVSLLGMSIYLVVGLFALTSFSMIGLLDESLILYLFIFFLIAFLTIGSFMMAVGSAVNELRETQSLMMPVTIVIMLPMLLWMPISRDPSSTLSVTASMIPPINSFGMLLRLASTEQPPLWQVWLSILIGVAFVLVAVWIAARIFRIGLLLTGKAPNYRTLLRWVLAG